MHILNNNTFEDYAFEWNRANIVGHIFTPDSFIGDNKSLLNLPVYHSFYIQQKLITLQIGTSRHVARDEKGLLVRCRIQIAPKITEGDPNFLSSFKKALPMFALTYGSIAEARIEINPDSGEVLSLPIFSFWVYAPPPANPANLIQINQDLMQ